MPSNFLKKNRSKLITELKEPNNRNNDIEQTEKDSRRWKVFHGGEYCSGD